MMPGEKNEYDPSWSPNGNLLAFGSNASFEPSSSALAIHLLDLRSHQVSTLSGSEGLYAPNWSPEGNHIVAQKAGTENLWIFDFKNQKLGGVDQSRRRLLWLVARFELHLF